MADLFCALLAKPTTALCHSSASRAGVPALPFRIKSYFPSQQPKGFCNYRSCTQGLGSLAWVEQSQQRDGNFGARHHREAVGVTNPLKLKLKPCWLLKFPILFKQRQQRVPLCWPLTCYSHQKTLALKQQNSPMAEDCSPEFPLSHNRQPPT